MIKLNGKVIEQGRFPDGTLALNMIVPLLMIMFEQHSLGYMTVMMRCSQLMSLVDMIKRNGIYSDMPYLPNAEWIALSPIEFSRYSVIGSWFAKYMLRMYSIQTLVE